MFHFTTNNFFFFLVIDSVPINISQKLNYEFLNKITNVCVNNEGGEFEFGWHFHQKCKNMKHVSKS